MFEAPGGPSPWRGKHVRSARSPSTWLLTHRSSVSCRASSSTTSRRSPATIAVLLNVEPDHLNWHETFEAYRAAKLRVFERARIKVVPRGSGLDGLESTRAIRSAEPRIPGAHTARTLRSGRHSAGCRPAGARDRGALRSFPGVSQNTRGARPRARRRCATSTTPKARTRQPRAEERRLRRAVAPRSWAARRKGEDFASSSRRLPESVRSIT